MLIFKKQENPNTKKVTIFFYWTGCKGTPFQLKKKKGKGWNKTTTGRQIEPYRAKIRTRQEKDGNKILTL